MRLPARAWWHTWEWLLAEANPPAPEPAPEPADDRDLRRIVAQLFQGRARERLRRVRQGRRRHRRK